MAPHVKSKRTTLKHKYKVEKKVRQHHREVRRANKNKPAIRKLNKKDPGIPNLWPFKQQMMEALEQKRAAEAAAKKARQQAHREAVKAARAAGHDPALAEVMASASKRTAEFEERQEGPVEASPGPNNDAVTPDSSKRAFMKEFKKVLESSDVILEVLDARDPVGCRCFEAERAIMASSGGSKRIVLVLNKVDMVPKDVTDKWLAYLRNEFPTVAFRASVQEGRGNKGQAEMSALAASTVNTSECLGAANLLSLLKNYSRRRNMKTSIAVGVIGYPNVGKSSLINSLKRARAVSAGASPGLTRSAQEVHIDKNIRLIDCPGIVFSASQKDALVLRNCLKVEQLHDPVAPVATIINRVGAEPLMVAYGVPSFRTVTEFLAFMSKLRGKYRRGGSFDVEAAARVVLQDWNSGKIPFYTLPPKGPTRAHISASVVEKWSEEFDVEQLARKEAVDLKSLAMDPKQQARFAIAPTSAALGLDTQMIPEDEPRPMVAPKDSDTLPSFHVAKSVKPTKGILKKKSKASDDMDVQ